MSDYEDYVEKMKGLKPHSNEEKPSGLEALKYLAIRYEIARANQKELDIIEKELKQAQEDKEVLNIFKNALTIKHTYVLPEKKESSDDTFSYACRYLFEITQNDIDEKLRKSLREWVLKNAFPEEVKALNEILALHDKWLGYKMSDFEFFTLLSEARDKYGLENEALL